MECSTSRRACTRGAFASPASSAGPRRYRPTGSSTGSPRRSTWCRPSSRPAGWGLPKGWRSMARACSRCSRATCPTGPTAPSSPSGTGATSPSAIAAFAARSQRYKLVRPEQAQTQTQTPRANLPLEKTFELYDMEADPLEIQNIAEQHPDIVDRLRAAYDRWFDDVSSTRGYDPPRIALGAVPGEPHGPDPPGLARTQGPLDAGRPRLLGDRGRPGRLRTRSLCTSRPGLSPPPRTSQSGGSRSRRNSNRGRPSGPSGRWSSPPGRAGWRPGYRTGRPEQAFSASR